MKDQDKMREAFERDYSPNELHLDKDGHYSDPRTLQDYGILCRGWKTAEEKYLSGIREARRLIGFMTNEKIAEAARLLDSLAAPLLGENKHD